MIKEYYSARDAAKHCKYGSVAMLDYLERSRVFVRKKASKQRGKGRRYTFRDLLILKVIKSLLDAGVSVATLRKSLQEFQNWRWKAEPTVLEDELGGLRYLIASGDRVYFAHSPDALVELSKKGQLAFTFILDMDVLHGQLCGDLGFPRPQGELTLSA